MFYEDYVSDWNVLKSSDFLNSNNFFYNENVKNKQKKIKDFSNLMDLHFSIQMLKKTNVFITTCIETIFYNTKFFHTYEIYFHVKFLGNIIEVSLLKFM